MSNLKIKLIVAAAENNAIGKDNQMLWHLPDDFKYFKNKTTAHSIVMGRKTFESMGKALPDRRNIVLTRNEEWSAEEVDVANSKNEVFSYCRDEREIYIIGGGHIYKQWLPEAQEVLLTRVHTTIDGDAYFPELPAAEWKKVDSLHHEADDRHKYAFTFETWERIA
ncbi:dihydrofolate reductase [Sphingobacterium oryzagri]|uniref:Dihydrofolate reductase n=1 Tax=Sphingobacterium oryzagri TaxID=3025669 RepID=A0ABY7WH95_9SPHI|nr:dihydrofolate reductase [Sphingobacterium sp. KACC 22765]WDF67886.1 dihydrofolate reductase [Sphingobacterium sp. KACC 22765]